MLHFRTETTYIILNHKEWFEESRTSVLLNKQCFQFGSETVSVRVCCGGQKSPAAYIGRPMGKLYQGAASQEEMSSCSPGQHSCFLLC